LEIDKLPYVAQRPVICMDEMPKQLLTDKQESLPCQARTPARQDYEYKRNDVADRFLLFEPLPGKRFVEVTEKRRRIECAMVMKRVSDVLYPQAEKIIVVLDNLNMHTPAAFYETFGPEEARRLVERFEFHFTPKHGRWLNMAEIELSALVDNAWIGVFRILKSLLRSCRLSNSNAMTRLLKCYGNLRQMTLAQNSNTSILSFRCDRPLG
jgi:DDE superfamily endonuclease